MWRVGLKNRYNKFRIGYWDSGKIKVVINRCMVRLLWFRGSVDASSKLVRVETSAERDVVFAFPRVKAGTCSLGFCF